MSIRISTEWKTVTVEPERLRCGLWGYEEGDINASYSADIYAEYKKTRRPFSFSHSPHVAMAMQSRGFYRVTAKAYPILHASYANDLMEDYRACGLKDSYVGKAIKRGHNNCIFGLPVIFKQRALKQNEIIDLCRRMYAYGGLFAAEAETYDTLILGWYDDHTDSRLRKAFMQELQADHLPQTREGMRELIEGVTVPELQQLSLL